MKSRKVVIDTNVFISAMIGQYSYPYKIFAELVATGEFQICLSKMLVKEYKGVSQREKFQKYPGFTEKATKFISFIEKFGIMVKPTKKIQRIKDESDNRLLEIAIETKETAENAARVKQDFLANMSHEIRTPMNAILGFTRILLQSEKKPEVQEYLQTIYDSADTLLVVINDILDFSKIQSGKFTIENVHFSMDKLLTTQQKLFSLKVDALDVNLIFDTDNRLPVALLGDPTRVNQILHNLIGNAIKFTKKGYVKISTAVESQEGDLCHLRIDVKDTGIGIAKDKQETVFNSFEQEKGDTTRLYGGTGLGLTIVKKLVELMDGKIFVESQEGAGSTFTVLLSLALGDETLVRTESIQIDLLAMELLVDCRILLAEDNRNNQILATKCLTEAGCEVDIAMNGKEAIHMLQAKPYDLVLMDVQMPVMDGIEATRVIKELPPPYRDIPIIAMTAHALKEEENLYHSIGMCEYISKPFKPQQLYSKLITVLEGKTWETRPSSGQESGRPGQAPLSLENGTSKGKELSEATASPEQMVDSWPLPPPDKLDYTSLENFGDGDEAFIKMMLEVFLEDTPEYLRQLEVATAEKNQELFKKTVHTLKSSILFLGLHHTMQLIEDIEDLETENIPHQILDKSFLYISQGIESVMQEIKSHINASS